MTIPPWVKQSYDWGKNSYDLLKQWLSKNKSLVGVLGAAWSLTAGVITKFVSAAGPPPPEEKISTAVFTTLAAAAAWFIVTFRMRPNTTAWKKLAASFAFFLIAACASLVYFDLFTKYTYLDPLGDRRAKGTVENEDWKTATDPKQAKKIGTAPVDASRPESEQIQLYWGFEPAFRWTQKSIDDNEYWLAISWYLAVFGVTGSIGLYVVTKPKQKP